MTNCPFCNLNSEKSRTLKTGKFTTVILSNPRMVKGHTLVIPNRHVEKPWQLTDEEVVAIFKDIFWIESKLLVVAEQGCDIRQNYRPFQPQGNIKVDHLHFHVIPRRYKDELFLTAMRYETGLYKALPKAERDALVKQFKN